MGLAQTVGTQLKIHLLIFNCTNMKTQHQFYGIAGMSSVSGKLSKFENHLNETAQLV